MTDAEKMREAAALVSEHQDHGWHDGISADYHPYSKDELVAEIAAAIRALPLPPAAPAVRVKPLVWMFYHANPETGFLPHETAEGFGGSYLIEYRRGQGGGQYDFWMPERVAGKHFDTLEAAKAAAQADYEARILSALEPQPAPVTLAEAAKVLLAAGGMPEEAKLAAVSAYIAIDGKCRPVAVANAWEAALRRIAEGGES